MIYIDNRTGSKKLANHLTLAKYSKLSNFERDNIPGDVYFTGNGPNSQISVGIEIKRIDDLIASTKSGRLFARDGHTPGQIPRMMKIFDVVYILVYGIFRASINNTIEIFHRGRWRELSTGRSTFSYQSYCSVMVECGELGVRVASVADYNSVASWVLSCYKWWNKKYTQHRLTHNINTSNTEGLRRDLLNDPITADMTPTQREKFITRVMVLSSLPNIRHTRAISIAKNFDSVIGMIQTIVTAPDVLLTVDGIGRTVAGSLKKHCE